MLKIQLWGLSTIHMNSWSCHLGCVTTHQRSQPSWTWSSIRSYTSSWSSTLMIFCYVLRPLKSMQNNCNMFWVSSNKTIFLLIGWKVSLCKKIWNSLNTFCQGKRRPNFKKFQAMRNWKRLIMTKGIQSFLGLANFYWKFIKGFSQMAKPLLNLLKKKLFF